MGRPWFATHAIGNTGAVRTRAPLLTRLCSGLLVGGLAVGAAVVVGRVALDLGRDASASTAARRAEATDVPDPDTVTRSRDRLEPGHDARRVHVGVLATALVLVASGCWWIAADRRATHLGALRPLPARPRAPPRPPALVCT